MTNLSGALQKTPEEQAFYASRGNKASYTQRKNRALIARIHQKEPANNGSLASLVAAAERLTRDEWISCWRASGWDGTHPYPYPAFIHVAPPLPAYNPVNNPFLNAYNPPAAVPAPNPRPNPPAPPARAHPAQQQAQAGPSRPSVVANQAYHPYGRPNEPVAGPSRLGGGAPHNHRARYSDAQRFEAEVSSPRPLRATQSQRDAAFSSKLERFYAQPGMQRDEEGRCELVVTRDNLLQTGYNSVMEKTPAQLKKLLIVKFHGEEGDDAGGLSKEFFYLLSKELFNPMWGLFEAGTEEHGYTTRINSMSGQIDPEHHLQHFRLFGRCIALSIFHHRLLDVRFASTFYAAMLGQNITLADIKTVDETLWKSLTWTLENDITGILDDETFSYLEDRFGEPTTIDIVPGGRHRSLTNQNKREWVDAMVKHKTIGRTQEQFDSFMAGINEILPRRALNVFQPSELEALMAGTSTLDVDDWKKHTELENYTTTDPQIKWLWQVVEGWDDAMRSRFLQFATGAERIPLTGFRDLRGGGEVRLFKVTRVGLPTALPAAHACFNRVDLPPYTSLTTLKEKLTMAVLESGSFEQA